MNFSREDFNLNARAICLAFEIADNECEQGRLKHYRSVSLSNWELCHGTYGYKPLYLVHPPVTISTSSSASTKNENEQGGTNEDLDDEDIIIDDQCCVQQIGTGINIKVDQHQQVDTQWTFSIVYSSTHRVPVLYFSVQELNGAPVGRRHLLDILQQQHERSSFSVSNDFPIDMWDFISQEEHPVTGLSSFFLHPCQSAERLKLLKAVANGQGENCTNSEEERKLDYATGKTILWSWMSMTLPAVGHSIPPSYFRRIQQYIANLP